MVDRPCSHLHAVKVCTSCGQKPKSGCCFQPDFRLVCASCGMQAPSENPDYDWITLWGSLVALVVIVVGIVIIALIVGH